MGSAVSVGSDRDIALGEIEFKNGYRALGEFVSMGKSKYNALLTQAVKEYKANASLEQGIDPARVNRNSDVKSRILGLEDLLQQDFLQVALSKGCVSEVNARYLDGTNRFLGQILLAVGLDEVRNFLYSLNILDGCCVVSFKEPEAVLTKVFVRGKKLDDVIRAFYVADDFTRFFEALELYITSNKHMQYWIEDDRNKSGWNTVKLYFVSTLATISGKTVAAELQLVTPSLFHFMKLGTVHLTYERVRMSFDPEVEKVYAKCGKNFGETLSLLKGLNGKMSGLIQEVMENGIFQRQVGEAGEEGVEFSFAVRYPEEIQSLMLNPSAEPPSQIILGSYARDSAQPFQLVNGKLNIEGELNHYLTREAFNAEKPIRFIIKWLGEVLTVAICPRNDCMWGGKGDQGLGQTLLVQKERCWVRDGIYSTNVLVTQPLIPEDSTLHTQQEVVIEVNPDQTITWACNGTTICQTPAGSAISSSKGYHLGFFSWGVDLAASIQSVHIQSF